MDISKLNPVSWIKTIAEVFETFDNSYFIAFLAVYSVLYFMPESINTKLLLNKYIAILSILAIASFVVLLARFIRTIGKFLNNKYKQILHIWTVVKEIKLMKREYYPLENKILDLLSKQNLQKFESDVLQKKFFANDIKNFFEEIEEYSLDYYDDLTEYGRRLYDIYQLDNTLFNNKVIQALEKLTDRNILYLNKNTYSINRGAWYYLNSFDKRIIKFIKKISTDLLKTIKYKYKNLKKTITKKFSEIKKNL